MPFAWERRSRLKGIGHGAASSSWENSDTHGLFLQKGLLEKACAIVPWLAWVPAVAERLERESIERRTGPLVSQGIRALCKKDWAVRVVFGGEEAYSSSAKDFPNFLKPSWWSVHSSEGTLLLDNMSAPWFLLPSTCVDFSERRLVWAHTRRLFTSV